MLLAVCVCAICYAFNLGTYKIHGAVQDLQVQTEGAFSPDGQFHGEPLADVDHVRLWGSLKDGARRDIAGNIGTISLGPFPGTPRVRFALTGHPADPKNEVAVELVATGARLPVTISDMGGRWNIVDVDLPPAWVGQPVRLIARDGSASTWLGISEPLAGGRGEGNYGLRQTLAAWAINGLLLGVVWLAALSWLSGRGWVDAAWLPLAAAGAVAAIAYFGFWVYFAHATAGKLFSVAVLLFAGVKVARSKPGVLSDGEASRVARLMAGVGLFYVALLHLFPSSMEFDQLAANRFRENLPGDNTLPFNLASAMFDGRSAKSADGDYQTSDRPPLQTAWLLLTWPVTDALGFNARGAAGTAAVWFQLLWIPAAYGLLRTLRLSPARATAWTGVMSLSGFFLQNTLFTWPKLSAAAFAVGAFAIWFLPTSTARARVRLSVGATLAALGWLSHGGVAFSYLAMAPWVCWWAWREGLRAWLPAVAVFLLLAAPWMAYQKIYDPPGNLLIKEHLAGAVGRDARSAWQTIRDSYRARPWGEIVAAREMNFALQVHGDWRAMLDFSTAGASARRAEEFFFTGRALSWWLLAIPLLGVVLLFPGSRGRFLTVGRWHASLLGWTGLAIVVWCLVMFRGGQAVIHQGSAAVMLGAFALFSAWLEHAGRWILWLIALLQAATLFTTYAVSNVPIHGPPVGLGFAIFAGAVLAAAIAWGSRAGPDSEAKAGLPSAN